MGTIREYTKKNGKITYQAEVRMKGYKPQRQTFRTKTMANKWIQDTESAIRDGRPIHTTEARRRTLKDLISRCIEQYNTSDLKGKKKQTALLSWWCKEYGHRLLSDVTPAMIAEGRDKLLIEITVRKIKRSPSTVNRYLSALATALRLAVKEWGWLDDSPMRKVTKPKESSGRDRFLSIEERDRLLEACRNSKNFLLHDLVSLSLMTGARYSELTLLNWEDIHFETNRLVFRETKNGDDRYLPLTEDVKEIFHRLKPEDALLSDRVFKPRYDCRNQNRQINVRGAFTKALKDTGIENFRWHDLRHTAASYIAMNGATQGELQAILGHRSVVSSARYRHFTQQHIHDVLSKNILKKFVQISR